MRARALVLVLAIAARAAAQPPSCDACDRGDTAIAQLGLAALRPLAGELAALHLDDPVTPAQYARLVDLRRRTPALGRVGALDDAGLAAVAASLCRGAADPCTATTTRALTCLADRCAVDLLVRDPIAPDRCRRSPVPERESSAPYGLSIDWGNGWQRSKYPSDGGAWSLGIAGRIRLPHRLGIVARVDRVAGRDAATDANHDGRDDVWTGSITRFSALAGPSFVLDSARFGDTVRFLQLDLLGGYMTTRSQPDEHGPAAGFDLAYQIWHLRAGLRVVQGFGDARDATMALGYLGISPGAEPLADAGDDCGNRAAERKTRLALGFDYALIGGGFSQQLGVLPTGFGLDAAWHLTHHVDALAHADVLLYSPGAHRERVIQHAALAGIRFDDGHPHDWFATAMTGYSQGVGITPSNVGSGPITDLGLGVEIQESDYAVQLALHGRFGLDSDNIDYRAVFLTFGFELRLESSRWDDRDNPPI